MWESESSRRLRFLMKRRTAMQQRGQLVRKERD
jgi:hypothetical protein